MEQNDICCFEFFQLYYPHAFLWLWFHFWFWILLWFCVFFKKNVLLLTSCLVFEYCECIVAMCLFRCPFSVKFLLHCLHWKFSFWEFPCFLLTCLYISKQSLLQRSHLYLTSSWTDFWCHLRFPWSEYTLWHLLQLNFLRPLWTELKCLWRVLLL